jgi:hypothetical protein
MKMIDIHLTVEEMFTLWKAICEARNHGYLTTEEYSMLSEKFP